MADNLADLRTRVRPGDIVLLHDPQAAGLAAGLRAAGARVGWRCHIGRDSPTELSDGAWAFLRPYVEQAEAVVFSRRQYAPDWVDRKRLWVITPSLDPFSTKNCDLPPAHVEAALRLAGVVQFPEHDGSVAFVRRDGTSGQVRSHTDLVTGGPAPFPCRLVLQVSRWDRLKDMAGVLTGFADASLSCRRTST